MTSSPFWLVILSALLSGLIGVVISTWHYRRFERRKLKFDTFRRLFAHRHAGVPGSSPATQKPFVATLNEVWLVFHDVPAVVQHRLGVDAWTPRWRRQLTGGAGR